MVFLLVLSFVFIIGLFSYQICRPSREWVPYTHPLAITCLIVVHLITSVYLLEIKPKKSIEINKSYLYSYEFKNEDPFYKFNIDTVKVLDIKNDYVLYMNDGKEKSENIFIFIDNTRPLDKK